MGPVTRYLVAPCYHDFAEVSGALKVAIGVYGPLEREYGVDYRFYLVSVNGQIHRFEHFSAAHIYAPDRQSMEEREEWRGVGSPTRQDSDETDSAAYAGCRE